MAIECHGDYRITRIEGATISARDLTFISILTDDVTGSDGRLLTTVNCDNQNVYFYVDESEAIRLYNFARNDDGVTGIPVSQLMANWTDIIQDSAGII